MYRMGYYGGQGARKVATVNPSATLPQSQPACLTDATTGLIDCGNWAVSASWAVPANATSGIYFARLVRADTQGASHVFFVVRDDSSQSDVLFQTSDTTWQAYNAYGGNSLYTGAPVGRAYKVSYNRPFTTRCCEFPSGEPESFVFNAEYPMVRWLEANGYDVSYFTGVDSDRRGNLISAHRVFLSVGHDEYWSGGQRANVEAARAAGTSLAFFSGNEIFWKTRWENSIDGSGTSYRTLVSYKETHANAVIDPQDPPTWTGTWRDPRFSPPGDGGRPENALSGTIFLVNGPRGDTMTVPDTDGKMRFWRNTAVANLAPGATATLTAGTLGAEWDQDSDNGFRPAGQIQLSTTAIPNAPILLDYGSTYGTGTAIHHLTLYRHSSGALVFGTGTFQWSWGLDGNHDRGATTPNLSMQQATVNLFADMSVQPATLQSGLVAATASTDAVAPTSLITAPANGAVVSPGSAVTISGTATDTGGGVVGGVEVSVDAGTTWHPANGRASWSYAWTAPSSGSVTIRSRATDDSGNIEAPGAGITVTIAAGTPTPAATSIWAPAATPAHPADQDAVAVELGVKFTSDVSGQITGIRFYKSTTNTGTHTGTLWNSAGTLLATATFSGETASGWQQVNFTTPVAISAGTVYVASYHTNVGHYAGDNNYFATAGVDNPPLHALRNGVSGGNGVYVYGASAFPTSTYQSSNYWVDVLFSAGTLPPTATATGTGTATATRTITATATASATTTATATASTTGTATATGAATATPTVTGVATATATATSTTTRTPTATPTSTAGAGACAAPANAIVAENCLAGNPASEWDVSGAGDATIQGFATDISVNKGGTVSFKVQTDATSYRLDIYRMGYYGGMGARKVTTITPSATLPQSQPACLTDATTGLVDCGNWAVSASWAVPANATSGIYFARLVRADTQGASHMFFIVRDDAGSSDLLFQTSDTTWQAYNAYGGNSLYYGAPAGRAYKVSYNRPFATRCCSFPTGDQVTFVFNAEYPMVRWLEANGYDVSYFTGVDSARSGNLIRNHHVFLSVGHDEYWSGDQRANVEAARNAGVHLAFFSGNESFWKTRWANSIDNSATPYRTLVCYKETHANAVIDPQDPPTWTGTWRDPRFSPPGDGGRPENGLTGTIFMVNGPRVPPDAIQVPAADGKMRFWRNTSIANQSPGQTATLGAGTLGFEWDMDLDNGARPAGLVQMSTAVVNNITSDYLLDYGSTYGAGTATHHLTLYRHASGALVFGAGDVQWSWGLDATHDAAFYAAPPADVRMQQATVNLFADMGVQPATLQSGLTAAIASTDTTAPTSIITSPVAGANLSQGSPATISGTATDSGGGVVGGVEVSVDGGTTWHPASGRESWSYSWTPGASGSATIMSRAADDSGNLETPSAGIAVSVGTGFCTGGCPTIWPSSTVPAQVDAGPDNPVELGVKFRSDVAGTITGIRFYKASTNTGTHVGNLWTSTGTLLASATFTGETASGWQQVSFASPVAISSNTVYVASYHCNAGHFSEADNYFSPNGVDSPPLHALADGVSGANGLYAYGSTSVFPNQGYIATNYWVDVVFSGPQSATATATQTATLTMTATATASPSVTPTATLSPSRTATATASASVTATVTGSPPATSTATATATVTATSTQTSTPTMTGTPTITATPTQTPTATLTGTSTATRTLTATATPTATPTPTPSVVTIWPASATPVTAASTDTAAVELGVKFTADVNGQIIGVRFYKGATNTGTHTGSLWSSAGALLATATFTGETASGWQQVNFSTPVAITAGTVYVASYHTTVGHYAFDSGFFTSAGVDNPPLHALRNGVSGGDGVYIYGASAFPTNTYQSSNYWVDVAFAGQAATPTATSTSSATQTVTATVTATPSRTATATATASSSATPTVTATVTGSPPATSTVTSTATVTVTPTATGTVTVTGTPTVTATASQTATPTGTPTVTATPTGTPTPTPTPSTVTIWAASVTPGTAASTDTAAVELGVKFTADVNGLIRGIRFYKGTTNTGTHTGTLWSSAGALLATATFTGETASGWQQVTFATPVSITAGTVYVASYHTAVGHYAFDPNYFSAVGVDNAPLHALSNGASGGNGVYVYGVSAFPANTYQSSNYWVDVVFSATP
ncbi:MAG TPA: N,N-dimethylformamidase beta subunit family domain-containing protein [Mycobacterium sp.]|nr:N,N-dimethylformamidase beta subunit family domain-containing protein [Mycobacterium sp.]